MTTDTATLEAPRRRAYMTIEPAVIERAYDDPDALIAAIRNTGPHRNLFAAENFDQGEYPPCFRAYWSERPGSIQSEAVRPFVENPNFIEAAKKVYGAAVVRPERLIINLNIPSPAQPPHMDFPTLRGIGSRPTWLTVIMGASKLFLPFEIQIASILTWFYRGEGGEFRLWSKGADQPGQSVSGPFWNRALVCDNEYTFHQACATGRREDYLSPRDVEKDCSIAWNGAAWDVIDSRGVVASFPSEKVRLMTLWKGMVFETERDAEIFDDHLDDLDHGRIVDIFAADLRARNVMFKAPTDPLNDPEWRRLLETHYPSPAPPTDYQPSIM